MPVLPFLSLFLAPVLDWVLSSSRWLGKLLLAALGLLSVLIQILGVTVDFNSYLLLMYERGIDSSEVNFRVDLSPLLGHWTLLKVGEWDLAWARDLSTGVDWPLLLWPLALLIIALVGWFAVRRLRLAGRWLLAGTGVVLLVLSLAMLARLPSPADDWSAGSQALSATLQEMARPDDVLVVDLLPYSDHYGRAVTLLDWYKADPAYWGWTRQEPISEERQALLASLSQQHQGLYLVLDTTPEGDPASTTERWLENHAFRLESRWLSPAMRLVRYQLFAGDLDETPHTRLDLRLGDRVILEGYSAFGPEGVQAGEVVAFTLFWRAEQPIEQSYTVFVQLLDQEGRLRAQADRQPVGGFRPTESWQPSELIRDNYGLVLPPDLPPGEYQLVAGLYLPPNQERLVSSTMDGLALGDYASLTAVMVVGPDRP